MLDQSPEQGALFSQPSLGPDESVGYRGPTACAAAGITYRQLDYWARTNLVVPTVRSAAGSGSQRLYSFKDILVLKVVKRLLDTGVSLQNIRLAVDALRARGDRGPGPDHAALRRHHCVRVHDLRGCGRPAARRPGGVRHRGQRSAARAGRLAGDAAVRAHRRRAGRGHPELGRAGPAPAAAHRDCLDRRDAFRADLRRPAANLAVPLRAHGRVRPPNWPTAPKGQLPRQPLRPKDRVRR